MADYKNTLNLTDTNVAIYAVGGVDTATGVPNQFVYRTHANALVAAQGTDIVVSPISTLVSAVAEAESHFQQGAVSSAGAVGVMQLMPETAASLGVNPYDAAQNIDGGTHYLRQMLDSFGGDVKKAVAAYNAGAQAVRLVAGSASPSRATGGGGTAPPTG